MSESAVKLSELKAARDSLDAQIKEIEAYNSIFDSLPQSGDKRVRDDYFTGTAVTRMDERNGIFFGKNISKTDTWQGRGFLFEMFFLFNTSDGTFRFDKKHDVPANALEIKRIDQLEYYEGINKAFKKTADAFIADELRLLLALKNDCEVEAEADE
jgi:hypothetical protein